MRTLFAFSLTFISGLVAAFILPYNMITPGVLIGGHSNLKNDCFACHSAFQGSSSTKCIVCHKIETIGKNSKYKKSSISINLFHKSILRNDCFACHTEHNGLSRELATDRFTHDLLKADIRSNCTYCHLNDKPVTPVHAATNINCSECHNTSDWKQASFSHDKFTGKIQCSSCHLTKKPADAIHNFSSTEINCATCHSTDAWTPANYDHDKYFVFDENHTSKCSNCHNLINSFKTYTCYNCHKHNREETIREHDKEGIRNIDNCVKCHRSGNEHDAGKEGRRKERESDERENE